MQKLQLLTVTLEDGTEAQFIGKASVLEGREGEIMYPTFSEPFLLDVHLDDISFKEVLDFMDTVEYDMEEKASELH